MEDGNGIELSLGLPCGGAADKLRSKDVSSSDIKTEERGNDNNLIGDVKNFHTTIIEIQDSDDGPKRSDPTHSGKQMAEENFFTDLGKSSSVGGDGSMNSYESNNSQFIKCEGLWVGDDKLKAVEEGKSDSHEMGQKLWPETSNKRKLLFEEINCPKKHEREVQHVETHAILRRRPHGSTETLPDERKASESAKGAGKQHVVEDGGASSSSQTHDEMKGNSVNFRSKEASHQQVVEGFPPEGSAIRPGIAPGLKFGGSGSYPKLPWVSTTGPGPNGRTISGVAYRYDKNQIKIVCACHGSHMYPDEFVQHANADQPNQEHNTDRVSFPSSNPAASAKS
ncbi:Ninja [Macleaya cordata]|uniref:Ninja-family protein n=1 Tax=Macleaya cordata TaxID=56857 RepID=A0A200QDW4_MACCD|nr:Ninja [Macleaya cordata]